MKFRSILKVPAHRELTASRLSATEISGEERRHESRKHQLGLYRILRIVLVLIALQSGDGLVGTTQLHTQLLAATEQVPVGISERSRRTQVARRIGALWLEGNGRRLVGAYLDVAIQEIAVRHFGKSDIGILHRLQSGKVIVSALQGRCAVRLILPKSSGIEQHLMAQVDAVAVIAQKVDIPHRIARMIHLWRITVALVLHQMQGHGDVLLPRYRICRKLDKVLMETEVAIIRQEIGDALALIVQGLHGESHTRLQLLILRLIELQELLYLLILHIIFHLAYQERLTGMQQVSGIQLLPLLGGE